ncbi:MAG: cysteine desulfurase [Candidatus Delongbacteria bacterium]|nr:cysteine desulfurase [bacterium]MBL7032625.1 cysteine desulfurase [Candidatus Delongbacteria bacterium]
MDKTAKPIYLDYNATTPIAPEVAAVMRPLLEEDFGNPSSSHLYGQQARKIVESARNEVAALLGCLAEEIIFTSGGSESNNMALKGIAWWHRRQGTHIITSVIEHPAVSEVCYYLEKQGYSITRLPVDTFGLIDPDQFRRSIRTETVLATIMLANNEVGSIQPIKEVASIAHESGILFHTDAAQAVGKMALSVTDLGVDLLTVAGHKLYAPKGVGALYLKAGVQLARLIHGADHEGNRRAGTENTLEIAGLGEACRLARVTMTREETAQCHLRDRLQAGLLERLPQARVNGPLDQRLPNTLSIGIPGIKADKVLIDIGEMVAASAGAACHTESVEISRVLREMRVPPEFATGTLRLSVGRYTTETEIDRALEMIVKAVQEQQLLG